HDPGQHRCAVNLMIVQEWLNRRVQSRLDFEATLQAHACYLADHWSLLRRSRQGSRCRCIQPASGIPLVQQNTKTLADNNFTLGASRREFAANQRNPRLGWQHVDRSEE